MTAQGMYILVVVIFFTLSFIGNLITFGQNNRPQDGWAAFINLIFITWGLHALWPT